MHTNSFWLSFPPDLSERIELPRSKVGGALRGLANILGKIAPLWVMCDPSDLRSISQLRSPFTERPTIYLYENIPGGVGLSEKLYAEYEPLLEACMDHMNQCICDDGCPTCAGPPMEIGNSGKSGVVKLLQYLLATAPA